MEQQALTGMNPPPSDTWKMADVWNGALLEREERPVTPRAKLWASELGRPPVDLWLKLKGTPYTNPPNARALRKFEAGNVYEWIVSLVLKRAGILQAGQEWCEHQYPELLPVSGKVDFIAGGVVNVEKAKEFIKFLEEAEIPDVFLRCFDRVITFLREKYPNGVESMPLEIKSVSAYAMDLMEVTKVANPMHRRQTFHYLKALKYPKGNIIYICRDDLRMMEFPVFNDGATEREYRKAIEDVSRYYKEDKMPPKERFVIFDEEYGRFSKNLGVEWSPYLTMLYGFQEPREYSEEYGPKASNWNRVMGRVKCAAERAAWLAQHGVTEEDVKKDKIEGTRKSGPQYIVGPMFEGKKEIPAHLQNGHSMTPANLVILEEIKKEGYSVEELLPKFKATKGEEEETA